MELTDEGHGHAVEAVASGEAVDEPVLGAQQLRAAAQAGDDAGDHEADQNVALDSEAIELGRRHVQPHRPELEALGGVEQEIVDEQPRHQSQHQGRGAPQAEDPAEHDAFRHRRGLGDAAVPQPVGVDHAHKEGGHIVEHDGNDHLVLAPVDLQQAGDQGPQSAGQGSGGQAQNDAGQAADAALGSHQAAGHRAHDELALASQVEHAAAVGEAGAQAGEDQRRGPGQGGPHVPQAAEGPDPQRLERGEGVGPQGRHDHAADEEGKQHRQHRHRQIHEPGPAHAASRGPGGAFLCFLHLSPLLTCRPWPG